MHAQEDSSPRIPAHPYGIPLLDHYHAPLKFARRHHSDVPRHDESGYAHYKDMQKVALANAMCEFEKELGSRCNVEHLEIQNQTLIVRHYSQSKLSQQELADLQKATHFDKKELQQWYKGAHKLEDAVRLGLSIYRFSEGLSVGHAHERRVPKDL
jgi:hypothetical protein